MKQIDQSHEFVFVQNSYQTCLRGVVEALVGWSAKASLLGDAPWLSSFLGYTKRNVALSKSAIG
jgi:hypothetical protein